MFQRGPINSFPTFPPSFWRDGQIKPNQALEMVLGSSHPFNKVARMWIIEMSLFKQKRRFLCLLLSWAASKEWGNYLSDLWVALSVREGKSWLGTTHRCQPIRLGPRESVCLMQGRQDDLILAYGASRGSHWVRKVPDGESSLKPVSHLSGQCLDCSPEDLFHGSSRHIIKCLINGPDPSNGGLHQSPG